MRAWPPRRVGARLFLRQFESPILLVLVGATVLAMALGDLLDGAIILSIVAASAVLGFLQERTAGRAMEALLARVRVEVEVLRGGAEVSVPLEDVVRGDGLLALVAGQQRDHLLPDARQIRAEVL